jgi:hypothetical protein
MTLALFQIYEKQIHKDGIRRAVTSDVEQAIERHYNLHDLRQLFKLGDAGDCHFLDRMSEENGRTGGEECGITHQGIIGVSSHDIIYDSESTTGTCENTDTRGGGTQAENPFSSPTKATNVAIRETTITERQKDGHQVLGRSQRILQNESGDDVIYVKTGSAKSNPTHSQPDESQNFELLLKKADRMVSSGLREEAMEIMMDGMDNSYDGLDKHQKIRLHSRIANLARELRWL